MANPNAPNFPRTSGSTNQTSKTPPDLHSGYETAGTNALEKLRLDRKRVERFLRDDALLIDVLTLVLSYAFILVAAWNDRLLGLPPNVVTWCAEYALAAALACEVVFRLVYVVNRPWYYYPLIAVDVVAILTVIPGLAYVTIARVARLLVSAGRVLQLIDQLARARGNPYLILLVYPLVVPIAAALFYTVERSASNVQVHNYFQALTLMMSYSLTVGLASNHPVTYAGKLLAGVMFLTGLMCVSIVGNALTDRYSIVRTRVVSAPKRGTHGLNKSVATQVEGDSTALEPSAGGPSSEE
jgi:hypothetical protein